jgi:hypothetical protein
MLWTYFSPIRMNRKGDTLCFQKGFDDRSR